VKLDAVPFNLDVTLCCGQVFRWEKKGEWWYGVARGRVFKVGQFKGKLDYVNVDEDFVVHYFGLDHDLQRVKEQVGRDEHIKKVLREFWGLRIIRQDPWECLISYICATYKGIPAIKCMLLNLSRKFGEKVALDGYEFYTFPTPEKLASATEKGLAECGLGYRAKYLLATSKEICSKRFELEHLRQLPYMQARRELCTLSGVGLKVADCILLFALDRLDAFPVDVWMKRAILNHYAKELPTELVQNLSSREGLSNTEYQRLSEFGRSYFGEYAGYAQEYLYHYERTLR
jgi:N-glycosylase/DNA lyase